MGLSSIVDLGNIKIWTWIDCLVVKKNNSCIVNGCEIILWSTVFAVSISKADTKSANANDNILVTIFLFLGLDKQIFDLCLMFGDRFQDLFYGSFFF